MINETNKRYLVVSKALPDLVSERRLRDADYLSIAYNQILSGAYAYILESCDPTGLVVHNGGLVYPTDSGSANRNYYGLFRYTNPDHPTLAQLTFAIDHSGSALDWLTDSNTGGTVDLNKIKFEFLIKRQSGNDYGWVNPFADYNSPYGIAKTEVTRSGIVTRVRCTLSIIPRVALNDIVIVRVIASSEWTNKIRNIKVVGLQ